VAAAVTLSKDLTAEDAKTAENFSLWFGCRAASGSNVIILCELRAPCGEAFWRVLTVEEGIAAAATVTLSSYPPLRPQRTLLVVRMPRGNRVQG